jgi:hypothetical protein
MHYKEYADVIPLEIRKEILNFFYENQNLVVNSNYMEKINNPWKFEVVQQLESILTEFDIDTSHNLGDNIYKHSYAYFPHTDTDSNHDTINVLIPLFVEGDNYQPFVVFDQWCSDKQAKTWMIDDDSDTEFHKNKSIRTSINNDITVQGCTDCEIDDNFYYRYLENNFRPKELFFGLTGHALNYKPGNLLIFNSKYIHATGKMLAKHKIGLSLKFKGKINT